MNDPDVERVERDQIVCADVVSDEPQPGISGRKRRSFDPTQLTWNIDRLDERRLPLDGQFCPASSGKYTPRFPRRACISLALQAPIPCGRFYCSHTVCHTLYHYFFSLQELVWMFIFLILG